MTPAPWFVARQPGDPLIGPEHRGVGLDLPVRASDCSGRHPSWYPFEVNVCDTDAPDDAPLTARQLTVSDWPSA